MLFSSHDHKITPKNTHEIHYFEQFQADDITNILTVQSFTAHQ